MLTLSEREPINIYVVMDWLTGSWCLKEGIELEKPYKQYMPIAYRIKYIEEQDQVDYQVLSEVCLVDGREVFFSQSKGFIYDLANIASGTSMPICGKEVLQYIRERR